MPVSYCGYGFPTHEAWEYILHVSVVHADDDISKRPHTAALTRLEETRGWRELKADGTRTFWANSALDLAKRSSQRTVPNVQVFGRIRSASRFGGSGPSMVKVEQQFSFAFLDKWIYF
jgi:hypothetical protein